MPCGGYDNFSRDMMDSDMDPRKEHYDPSKPVCGNQNDFNMAVNKAIKYTNNKNMKKGPWATVCAIIWVLFFFWALMLAMQVPAGHERVEHVLFAILFSPAYVLAHYVGAVSKGDGAVMGFARFGCGSPAGCGPGGCSGQPIM